MADFDISRAPAAALNLVLEHYALPLARKMEEDFGTPYLYLERPYTLEAIETDYLQISEALNISLNDKIIDLKQKTLAAINAAKQKFDGSTCILGVQQGRAFDLCRLLTQLGTQPLLLYANRIMPNDLSDIETLLAQGVDFKVLRSGDALKSDGLVERLKPDYYIGHSDHRVLARFNVKARSLMRAYYTPGFAGTEHVIALLKKDQTGSDILQFKEQYISA